MLLELEDLSCGVMILVKVKFDFGLINTVRGVVLRQSRSFRCFQCLIFDSCIYLFFVDWPVLRFEVQS
jgi:hypothetical protein